MPEIVPGPAQPQATITMSLTECGAGCMVKKAMNTTDELVVTHFEDLKGEIEAGSRRLTAIAEHASMMRQQLLLQHLKQAAIAGALVREIAELRRCVQQQRERLSELRRAIRQQRRPKVEPSAPA